MVDVKVVPGPAAGDRAQGAARGSRRHPGHQRQRRSAAGLQQRSSSARSIWRSRARRLLILGIPLGDRRRCSSKLTSRGPVFYRQERMGLDGKPFTIVKFRSMHDDAESGNRTGLGAARRPAASRRSDASCADRISTSCRSSGTCCRGDMSIVGPRPERPHFVEQFRHRDPAVHAAPQGEGRA